jgi:hypothetical protein
MARPITRLRVPCSACGSGIGVYCVSRKGAPIVQVHKVRREAASHLLPVTVHLKVIAGPSLMLTERRELEVVAHPKGSIRQQTIPIHHLTQESWTLIDRLPGGWTAKAAREVPLATP